MSCAKPCSALDRGLDLALLDLLVKYIEYLPFHRVLLQLKCLFFEHLISWSVAWIEQRGWRIYCSPGEAIEKSCCLFSWEITLGLQHAALSWLMEQVFVGGCLNLHMHAELFGGDELGSHLPLSSYEKIFFFFAWYLPFYFQELCLQHRT